MATVKRISAPAFLLIGWCMGLLLTGCLPIWACWHVSRWAVWSEGGTLWLALRQLPECSAGTRTLDELFALQQWNIVLAGLATLFGVIAGGLVRRAWKHLQLWRKGDEPFLITIDPRPELLIVGALGLIVVWLATAYPRGVIMARLDVARGVYAVRGSGYPPRWLGEWATSLAAKYDVHLVHHGGCVVFPNEDLYDRGYNSVSQPAILGHFGRDVIGECEKLAQERQVE